MDPTAAELATFTTVEAIGTWVGFTELTDENSIGGSLFKLLGLTTTQAPRIIGIISEADFTTAVQAWRIPRIDPAGQPLAPPDRAPTMAEIGQSALFGRTCRIVSGNGETIEQLTRRANAAPVNPPSVPAANASSSSRKLKMSSIASQVDDSEFDMAPEAELMRCFKRYESVFGKGERPEQDQEPTPEQVSAVRCILERGSPPFVDFAVFGPHGHRIMKKVRLSGVNIGRDGQLQTVELYGPPNIIMWEASFNVLMNTLVMLDAVDLGALVTYKQHIVKLHDRYSSRTWPIIYQADNRCRLEHMERTRRILQAAHEEARSNGATTEYDDARPWNLVFKKVVSDDAFWRDQVLEPALLVLTKVAGLNEVVQGDAGVLGTSQASNPREAQPAPARMAQPQGIRPRNANRIGRYHQTEGGKYTANRTGYAICSAYNGGECNDTAQGIWCTKSHNMVHQCDRCLGSHPSTRCPHGEMQIPGFVKNNNKGKKGGGSHKGKGKGQRHQGRQPYWPLEDAGTQPDQSDTANETASPAETLTGQQEQNLTNAPHPETLDNTACLNPGNAVLYLFSGPLRHNDGVPHFLAARNIECRCVDTEISPDHDLLDQSNWESLWEELPNYEARLLSPPCGTFSAARRSGDGGPQPLRSSTGPGRYGLASLKPAEKEKVKVGNVLAIRSSRVCKESQIRKKPWILEQPHHRKDQGKTSMFTLDEFEELMGLDGVIKYTFDQCRFGAPWEKATDLLSNIQGLDSFNLRCNHSKRSWTIPWSGEKFWSAHPPLKGRQLAIPSEEWGPHLLRQREPAGDYLTRSAAAYPSDMNRALAEALAAAISSSKKLPAELEVCVAEKVDSSVERPLDPKPVLTLPLKGTKSIQNDTTDTDRYSLRNIHKSVTDRMLYVGKQIANLIERKLDQDPEIQDGILSNLGKPIGQVSTPDRWIDDLRFEVAQLLRRNRRQGMDDECDVSSVNTDKYHTVIRAHFMKYWAMTVDDPGTAVADWMYAGAPAGLEADLSDLDAVCPHVDPEAQELHVDELFTSYDSFENYAGVDDDDDATQALGSYKDKGYLAEFGTLQELQDFVGGRPVLSKLGCIKRTKFNADTKTYTTKNRIILDCKESRVSKAAVRTHKSVLPRVSDAVQSALVMMSDLQAEEQLTMLITDVIDAFWLVPLRHVERKYFCAKLKGRYYAFLRTAQGSRAAPLTFAATIALAGRLVQSLLSGPCLHRRSYQEARMQVYVDDPLTLIRGTEARTKRLATVSILGWTLLGFPLAFHKAVMSPTLTWVGVKLQLSRDKVTVEVPESKVSELQSLIKDSLSTNLISKKSLRTLIGKAMSIASVLYTWRPFIHEMYSALHSTEGHAPVGCVWTKQVKHSLEWILCFLSEENQCIERIYTVSHFLQEGPAVLITWDASPFGMGATLQVAGEFTQFFAVGIQDEDCDLLGIEVGSCKSQQTLEALSGLVALRVWAPYWQGQRATLQIRGDNVGALTLFASLKGSSGPLRLIAAEFALDLGKAEARPDLIEHIPGMTNIICDVLSRRYDPAKTFYVPKQLANARPIRPPSRNQAWWRSLSNTSATPKLDSAGGVKRQKTR